MTPEAHDAQRRLVVLSLGAVHHPDVYRKRISFSFSTATAKETITHGSASYLR
jgi:hypothetical protein